MTYADMDFQNLIARDGLSLIQACLRLLPAPPGCRNFEDVVFISIDFENLEHIRQLVGLDGQVDLNSKVGIANLDTKYLASLRSQATIKMFNLVTGSSAYCVSATQIFIFGQKEKLCPRI